MLCNCTHVGYILKLVEVNYWWNYPILIWGFPYKYKASSYTFTQCRSHTAACFLAIVLILVSTWFAWWRHQMDVFPRYWPFVRGIHRLPVIPAQRPVTQSFEVFFHLKYRWVNNDEAGDLRRHRCHYDVTVMESSFCSNTRSFIQLLSKCPCPLCKRMLRHDTRKWKKNSMF